MLSVFDEALHNCNTVCISALLKNEQKLNCDKCMRNDGAQPCNPRPAQHNTIPESRRAPERERYHQSWVLHQVHIQWGFNVVVLNCWIEDVFCPQQQRRRNPIARHTTNSDFGAILKNLILMLSCLARGRVYLGAAMGSGPTAQGFVMDTPTGP